MIQFTKKYIKYWNFNEKNYFKDFKPFGTNYAKFAAHVYTIIHVMMNI